MQSTISGENPLDFITKNLRQGPVTGLAPAQEPISQTAVPTPEVKAETPLPKETPNQIPIEAKTDSTPPVETKDGDIEPGPEGQGHFKRLRTALKETAKTLEETKAEAERLRLENEKYKTGEAISPVLQEKENKIAELSRYEKLVSLKTSKAYQEAYVKPSKALKEKVVGYGKEYGIPEDVMNQALSLKGERELNGFLEDHFDSVAALEVKQAIRNVQGLEERAKAAELEPQEEFERLQEQHEAFENEKRAHLAEVVQEKAKSAWVKALTNIQKEGRITTLLHKENDSQFNENYSKPIREKSAQEYGRIVSALIANGLQELPDDEATALANYILHANASAVNFEMGKAALNYATELEESTSHITKLLRPEIGGSGGGGMEGSPAKGPSSPQEFAQTILTKHVLAVR